MKAKKWKNEACLLDGRVGGKVTLLMYWSPLPNEVDETKGSIKRTYQKVKQTDYINPARDKEI